MKVVPTVQPQANQGAPTPRSAAEGFRIDFSSTSSVARPAASGVAAAAAVSDIGALMALQGVGGADAKARALRKGRRLLDALDRLQLALLEDGPRVGHLQLLRKALAEQRERTDDPDLDSTLDWAEVRAAVEAAKLER
jgi:hypothetical protein